MNIATLAMSSTLTAGLNPPGPMEYVTFEAGYRAIASRSYHRPFAGDGRKG